VPSTASSAPGIFRSASIARSRSRRFGVDAERSTFDLHGCRKLRGMKRATVALARRIGVVLRRMWRDGTAFRFTREEAMALRMA